jgi:hypothetical protein
MYVFTAYDHNGHSDESDPELSPQGAGSLAAEMHRPALHSMLTTTALAEQIVMVLWSGHFE